MEKSTAILAAVAHLRARLGTRAFDLLDYWPQDPDILGITRPGEEEPCVCLLTAGKSEGSYDLNHGSRVYHDCLIQGVESVVRQALREESAARRRNRPQKQRKGSRQSREPFS